MQIINNSNTKVFCNDCKNSLHSCKNGHGSNILPCYILRKLAKKCTFIYNQCYFNEDNLIPDFYTKIVHWCSYGVKYLDNLSVRKELIMLSMSFVINSHTGESLDFINEFSDDIVLDQYDREIVIKLYKQIFVFQTKINNELFATPGYKEAYLAICKAIVNNATK